MTTTTINSEGLKWENAVSASKTYTNLVKETFSDSLREQESKLCAKAWYAGIPQLRCLVPNASNVLCSDFEVMMEKESQFIKEAKACLEERILLELTKDTVYGSKFYTNTTEKDKFFAAQAHPADVVRNNAVGGRLNKSCLKLDEILYTFNVDAYLSSTFCTNTEINVRHLDLAGAPGGFVQCVQHRLSNSHTIAISLRGGVRWRVETLDKSRLSVVWGPKDDGNLLSVPEKQFAEYLTNQCADRRLFHIITADGAVGDIEGAGSNGRLSSDLVIAEAKIAIHSLCVGGVMILKLFDCLFGSALELTLLSLHASFDVCCLHKPIASRTANSERYFVGLGFRGVETFLECFSAVNIAVVRNWPAVDSDGKQITISQYLVSREREHIRGQLSAAKTVENEISRLNTDNNKYLLAVPSQSLLPGDVDWRAYQAIVTASNDKNPQSIINAWLIEYENKLTGFATRQLNYAQIDQTLFDLAGGYQPNVAKTWHCTQQMHNTSTKFNVSKLQPSSLSSSSSSSSSLEKKRRNQDQEQDDNTIDNSKDSIKHRNKRIMC